MMKLAAAARKGTKTQRWRKSKDEFSKGSEKKTVGQYSSYQTQVPKSYLSHSLHSHRIEMK